MRTMEDIAHLYQPLEDCIKNVFLPSFLQFSFSDSERKLFSLPAKYGGLGVFNPTEICPYEFQSSCNTTAPLVKMITDQRLELSLEGCHDMDVQIKGAKSLITNTKCLRHQQRLSYIKTELSESLQKQVDLLCRKESSSWLTSLPLQEYDFVLNKEEFVDVMCIRYLHPLKNMPKKCACGTNNSLDHALICMKGGYVAMRHNQIRDLIINFLIESGCKDIVREPHLLPLTGETFTLRSVNTSQEARLVLRSGCPQQHGKNLL